MSPLVRRIRRMLAVCAAGRILNPITARSQVIGAMTMGAGGALTEELAVDTRHGFFVNHDLAGYGYPFTRIFLIRRCLHGRDGPIFVSDEDSRSGVNSVYVASRRLSRTRSITRPAFRSDITITLDKLIGELPDIA